MTAEKHNKVVLRAKQNLVAFRKLVLPTAEDEVKSAEFHYEWSEILLKGKRHTAIEGFRESAKSSYVLRAFPAYCIAYPSVKRDYVVIIKANARLAQAKLKEIEREVESNPLLKNQIHKIVDQSAERYSIDVHDGKGGIVNVLFEAYGKGASIRGLSNQDRRPKIVIVDDPQDTEDARSETVVETDWDWFVSDVMFLGKRTRIFIIGNNLGERCIIERIIANKNELDFDVMKTPVMSNGVSTWPEMFSIEAIEAQRESYRKIGKIGDWLREKMCEAVSEETRIFNKDDYRYFHLPTFEEKSIRRCRIKATLDPASSKNSESCYRAIVVNAVDVDGNWFVLDVPFGRWDSAQLIDQIFATVKKWKLKEFGIEKGIFKQVLEPFIIKEMSNRQTFFNIVPIEHARAGTKLERIKILQPRFKAHTIYFAQEASWLGELESELAGVTKDEIKSLYIDLCLAKGTKIATMFGDKKIEDIKQGDRVITPLGIRRVREAKQTGYSGTVKKFGLQATSGHKVFSFKKGFASIDDLCYNEQVSRYNIREVFLWALRSSLFLMAENTILTGRESIIALSRQRVGKERFYTEIFGKSTMGKKFLTGCRFIMLMVIHLITALTTYALFRLLNIGKYILSKTKLLWKVILRASERRLISGISLTRDGSGIVNTLFVWLKRGRQNTGSVMSAGGTMSIVTPPLDIVRQLVGKELFKKKRDILNIEFASSATHLFNALNISRQKPAEEVAQLNTAGNTHRKEKEDKVPVYNLEVEGAGVYYANGVLVSNCDALAMHEQIAEKPYYMGEESIPETMRTQQTEYAII